MLGNHKPKLAMNESMTGYKFAKVLLKLCAWYCDLKLKITVKVYFEKNVPLRQYRNEL